MISMFFHKPLRVAALLAGGVLAIAAPGHAAAIAGGSTTVDFSNGFLTALTTNGITVTPVAPATVASMSGMVSATFPISGGDTTSMIDHWGGLTLTQGSNSATIEDFIINLTSDKLTGTVMAGGTTTSGVTLFDISIMSGMTTLTVDSQLGGAANALFGFNPTGATVGTASVNAVLSPEPGTYALLTVGCVGLVGLLKKRKKA